MYLNKKNTVHKNLLRQKVLKDNSGVKWIWDIFKMITRWDVRLGAQKRM